MTARRRLAAAAALACAVAAAGCGIGPGAATEGTAYLTVTRDYGAERLLESSVDDPPESETVLRMLDSEADITTRYGGGFVQSIEGLEGAAGGQRPLRLVLLRQRDRVAQSAPPTYASTAATGSGGTTATGVPRCAFPPSSDRGRSRSRTAPRASASRSGSTASAPTTTARGSPIGSRTRGSPASIGAPGARSEGDLLRVVVGTWDEVQADSAVAQIEDGPATSGVFADFEPSFDAIYDDLVALDPTGREAGRFGPGTGPGRSGQEGEEQPTWVVTGTDEAGVEAAVGLLDPESLRDRYAVAITSGGREIPLPVQR